LGKNGEELETIEEQETYEKRDNEDNSGVSQMVTYLICDLRKEFFKRVQARFR